MIERICFLSSNLSDPILRHLEGNSRLVIIKNAGHAMNLEKPKEFCLHLKSFLTDQRTPTKV